MLFPTDVLAKSRVSFAPTRFAPFLFNPLIREFSEKFVFNFRSRNKKIRFFEGFKSLNLVRNKVKKVIRIFNLETFA